jgi:hypothetical protein
MRFVKGALAVTVVAMATSIIALADVGKCGQILQPIMDQITGSHDPEKLVRTAELNKINAEALTLPKLLPKSDEDHLDTSVLHGAMAYGIANASPEKISDFFSDGEQFKKFFTNIETLSSSSVEEFSSNGTMKALVSLAIKMPALSGLDDLKVRIALEGSKVGNGYRLNWKQFDSDGDIEWTRGEIFIDPISSNPSQSLVTIYAIHVLKADRAIPFLLRGAAKRFVVTHYSNFVKGILEAFR